MRSFVRVLGPLLLAAGVALLGAAVATGGARLYLVLILPVITGSSPLFWLSVILLVLGLLLLPLAFGGLEFEGSEPAEPTTPESADPAAAPRSGGLILLGPVPIFFGAWRRNPPLSYRWAVVLGVVLLGLAVLLWWWFSVR